MLTLPVCGHEIVHNNGLRVTFSMIVWCYVLYSIKKVEREIKSHLKLKCKPL